MSDYEKINMKAREQKVWWQRAAFTQLIWLLGKVVAALLVFLGLAFIKFISTTFMMILIAFTVCAGSFKAGYIWRDIKF